MYLLSQIGVGVVYPIRSIIQYIIDSTKLSNSFIFCYFVIQGSFENVVVGRRDRSTPPETKTLTNIYSDSQFLKDYLDKEPVYGQKKSWLPMGPMAVSLMPPKQRSMGSNWSLRILPAKNLRIFLRISFLVKITENYRNMRIIKSPI